MRIALVADPAGGGLIQPLAPDGAPAGPAERVADLAAAVAAYERRDGGPDARPSREALSSSSRSELRWVLHSAEADYPRLVRAGVRVSRCHDVALIEALLLARDGRFGAPRSLPAAWARMNALPEPEDLPHPAAAQHQSALFGVGAADEPTPAEQLDMLVAVHADQLRRLKAAVERDAPRLPLLAAAESAGGLVAAEMAADGVPWRTDVHDAVLTGLLGPRPFGDARPAKLADLAVRIGQAFGQPPGRGFNPDSPSQTLRALRHAGLQVTSTRAWQLRELDHPGVKLLLEYKELARLHAAHGWAWQDAWVRGGRFYPEYVVGGVVSGRWGTRNSGALQIPKIVRRAVTADEGWSLIVADAGQLEPRVLAAVSEDRGLARAGAEGDLYAALAAEAFRGDRAAAKLALLGAMYGQTSGGIGPLLAVLRKRFPAAMGYVEDAARVGEQGGVVYSRLGRACPPPSRQWRDTVSGLGGGDDFGGDGYEAGGAYSGGEVIGVVGAGGGGAGSGNGAGSGGGSGRDAGTRGGGGGGESGAGDGYAAAGEGGRLSDASDGDDAPDGARRSGQASRARGRFTRNFVIQASAADWALVWLATLRGYLAELAAAHPDSPAPYLAFFVHDEVVVHTPAPLAEQAARAVVDSADAARRIVFGDTPVRFPLSLATVDCYADAK